MSRPTHPNPFVGPRPIGRGEALHGRATELRALQHRLIARRIVVVHGPSGAGKTSLVEAGLVPWLETRGFDVWAPVRVHLDPAGLTDIPAGANRYVLSALMSLEEDLPEAHRRSAGELAALDFSTYLERRPRRKGRADRPVVLIFDAFEEILTVAPHAIPEKIAFFESIGRALDRASYSALFLVREDHLGGLAPYRDRIPTQMAETFRLDLLGREGAREAAASLAALGGRAFPSVDLVIDDLATRRVLQPGGHAVTEPGHLVEPILLQVVCRRLWAAVPASQPSITAADVAEHAGVSGALAAYYAASVSAVSAGDVGVEQAVRRWCGVALISGGVRSRVRRAVGRSGGLANEHIDALVATTLIRAEQRAGATWYELIHDRLIGAVESDNRAWDAAHLQPVQEQARVWEAEARSDALLLSAEALPAALAWAAQHPERVSDGERDFIDLSSARRARQARRRLVLGASAAIVIGLLVTATLVLQAVRIKEARAAVLAREALEATVKTTTARTERAEADGARALAEAEAAELRAVAAETEQQRLERTLALLEGARPALRAEVDALNTKNLALRWEILQRRGDNGRLDREIARSRVWAAGVDGEVVRLRALVAAWSFDEAELQDWDTESAALVATLDAEREDRTRRLEASEQANEAVRGRLLAAGFEAWVPRRNGDTDQDGLPDVVDRFPERPFEADPALERLRARLRAVEDEHRSLVLLRDDLQAERARLERESKEAATRGAALAQEAARVQAALKQARRTEEGLSSDAKRLQTEKEALRDRSVRQTADLLSTKFELRRLDLYIDAMERENEVLTQALSRPR